MTDQISRIGPIARAGEEISGGLVLQTEASYFEIIRLIERLHRRQLDVLRANLNREGIDDINAVQVMLLNNIGDEEVVIRDLIDRGYYLGSNVSYNVKKLVENGYLQQERSQTDRRSVRVKVSERGKQVCATVNETESKLAERLEAAGGSDLLPAIDSLKTLERVLADYIHYG